ncbi:MAG: hypothetical protein WCF67_18455 [Chitinophagaceae bacterium]
MSRSILLFLFLLFGAFAFSQNNALLLQKRGKTKQTYFAGHYISIQTRQGNFADGLITRILNDTIYIRHFDIQQTATSYGGIYFDTTFRYTTAIHYKDISALVSSEDFSGRKKSGTLLMIAGGGVMALGAVNGLYRGDPVKEWYKPSGYITAGALAGLGLLMKKSGKRKTPIGKKYSFKILTLSAR